MSNLSVWSLTSCEEWDRIVCSFAEYDVHYLSGYVSAFKIHGEGEPYLFYYESRDLRGMNVVMRRDISKDTHFAGKLPENTCFDFATPYGYGGWVLEGSGDTEELFAKYQTWCQENGVVCEFVRFSLYSNSCNKYYGEVIQRTNNVVRELNRPMDEIMMDFEHKVRKNVKRAESSGLSVKVDLKGENLESFLRIYNSTMMRNQAKQSYYFEDAFYREINTMTGHFAYFYVLLGDKTIATELVLMGPDAIYSFLGGTDDEYFSYRPNDYLKCCIIRWGIENGYKRFVLGGGYGADDGIFRYKKSFAPNGIIPFYTGQAIFDPKAYDMLVEMRTDLQQEAFFPKYRA